MIMHIKYIYNMSVAATSDKETKQEKLFEHLQVHQFPAACELAQWLGQHVAHFKPQITNELKKKKKKVNYPLSNMHIYYYYWLQ